MSDFHIVLPSNSNPNTHVENVANKYIVSWETPVILDDLNKWKVALTEISFNHSTWTIRPGHEIRREHTRTGIKDYTTNLHLLFDQHKASYAIHDDYQDDDAEAPRIDVFYLIAMRHIKFVSRNEFVLELDKKSAQILGLVDSNYTVKVENIVPLSKNADFKRYSTVIPQEGELPHIDIKLPMTPNTNRFINVAPITPQKKKTTTLQFVADKVNGLYQVTAKHMIANMRTVGDVNIAFDKNTGKIAEVKGNADIKITYHTPIPIVDVKNHIFDKSLAFASVPQFLRAIRPIFQQVVGDVAMSESNLLQMRPNATPVIQKTYAFERSISDVIKFRNGFHHVLGFRDNKAYPVDGTTKHINADFRPVLFQGITHMYIYASICAPIQVGNVRAPLLKTIWIKPSRRFALNEIKHLDFENPMYVPVSGSNFNSIEINIRLDSGELVPFNYGAVTSLTLHFKRDV